MSLQSDKLEERKVKALERIGFALSLMFIPLCAIAGILLGKN